jgi:glycosyltransferase involved in cell wall biosynthesis
MANSGWSWHLCAAPAIWIARCRGIPAIVNYRGGEAEAFLERQHAWVKPTMRRARFVIVPSGFLEAVFRRFGVATTIVPNIIDLDRFFPAPSLPAQSHLVVARNLEDIYDIPTALRAFATVLAAYPTASMTVAGSGPKLEELQGLARELGIANRVRFSGRLDNERMAELYRDASCVLNPSTADNMPNSLLEAMASGVPVVTTDVGGIPYLVEDGTSALLVPPRDPSAMAAAVLRVLAEPALAHSLRQAGIAAASHYTWLQVRPRLFDVYAEALGVASLSHSTS